MTNHSALPGNFPDLPWEICILRKLSDLGKTGYLVARRRSKAVCNSRKHPIHSLRMISAGGVLHVTIYVML
jgi:hypothetical protein